MGRADDLGANHSRIGKHHFEYVGMTCRAGAWLAQTNRVMMGWTGSRVVGLTRGNGVSTIQTGPKTRLVGSTVTRISDHVKSRPDDGSGADRKEPAATTTCHLGKGDGSGPTKVKPSGVAKRDRKTCMYLPPHGLKRPFRSKYRSHVGCEPYKGRKHK